MNKKTLKKLITISITKNSLDPKKVEKIANVLSQKELKEYVRAIRDWEQRKKVVIISPKALTRDVINKFKKMFVDKKVINNIDPSLVVGLKIINNDLVYDLSFKNTLKNLTNASQGTL